MDRTRRITRVTGLGLAVNLLLTAGKMVAGVLGRSAAMLADGMHSLSDLAGDVVLLAFLRVSARDRDKSHDFGHGKFETFATLVVAVLLCVVAAGIGRDGAEWIVRLVRGETLPQPGMIALWAAVVSILVKEALYRITVRVGKAEQSPAVVANAWHHRTDALSSVGSLLGIGGALLLGEKWTVLDPVAALVIACFILVTGIKMALPAVRELLDASLPDDEEEEVLQIMGSVPGVRDVHGLKTLRAGRSVVIEAHIVVDPQMSVAAAHDICDEIERRLRGRLGPQTQISLHIEPAVDAL